MLDILQKNYKLDLSSPQKPFLYEELFSPKFRNMYGEYLLGEIKDQLAFYYEESEYELFIKFFEFLNGKSRFEYDDYLSAYANFCEFIKVSGGKQPQFLNTKEAFLQFLYDMNIISFVEETEDGKFFRWCFRERNSSNISPKVKTHASYEIHYGLANALNTGKAIRRRNGGRDARSRETAPAAGNRGRRVGRIKWFAAERGYGFVIDETLPVDVFVGAREVEAAGLGELRSGQLIEFRLDKDRSGKLIAVELRALDERK